MPWAGVTGSSAYQTGPNCHTHIWQYTKDIWIDSLRYVASIHSMQRNSSHTRSVTFQPDPIVRTGHGPITPIPGPEVMGPRIIGSGHESTCKFCAFESTCDLFDGRKFLWLKQSDQYLASLAESRAKFPREVYREGKSNPLLAILQAFVAPFEKFLVRMNWICDLLGLEWFELAVWFISLLHFSVGSAQKANHRSTSGYSSRFRTAGVRRHPNFPSSSPKKASK